jgi:hypothetical protein
MACKQWNDAWIARLYDELSESEESELASHLERCADCRETLEALRASRELLQEAAPEVPSAPRVIVLRPRPVWPGVWSFATGGVCALVLFSLGFWAGPRWTSGAPATLPVEARVENAQPSSADLTEEPRYSAEDLLALERRLDALEQRSAPDEEPAQLAFQEEIEDLETRFNERRAADLEQVIRTLAASELRTGTWMDQTQDVLTLLAMRQDPRFSER